MSKYSENMPPDLEKAIGWMSPYIEDNKTFMDFGCSTGYFGSLIKEGKNNKVYGVEISDDKKEAQKKLDGVYSFDIDGEWPKDIYERKYDYIFFGDVIEHLKNPAEALKKCKRLLTPNGLLFVSTPNVAHISIRLELLSGNFDYEPMGILDNTHLKYFTRKSLVRTFEEAGYEIINFDFTPNDYPDSVIKKLLKKAGVETTDKFWQIVNTPEARAFQFKVVAKPTQIANNPAPQLKDTSKPEAERNATYNDLIEQVKNMKSHAKEQAKIIAYYQAQIKEWEERYSALQESQAKSLKTYAKIIYKKIRK